MFTKWFTWSVKCTKNLLKSSGTTLSKYMEELVAAKILTTKKYGSEVYYLNDDLIRILAD